MEIAMPNVGGKKFPYTAAGKKAAASAMKKKKQYGTTTKRKMPARKKLCGRRCFCFATLKRVAFRLAAP